MKAFKRKNPWTLFANFSFSIIFFIVLSVFNKSYFHLSRLLKFKNSMLVNLLIGKNQ
jgi:hypothetical protein